MGIVIGLCYVKEVHMQMVWKETVIMVLD